MKKFFRDIIAYYKRFGLRAVVFRIVDKLTGNTHITYSKWYQKVKPTRKDLEKQRNYTFEYNPDILVLKKKTDSKSKDKFIKSLDMQTYTKWKFEYCEEDEEILQKVKNSDCEYVMLANPEIILRKDMLFECVKVLNEFPETDAIYSDEDYVDFSRQEYLNGRLKPNLNLDLLRSMNYIYQMLLVKRGLFLQAYDFYDASTEEKSDSNYDYIFKCVENSQNIYHIPKVLYHRNVNESQNVENEECQSILNHYMRTGIHATVEKTEYSGIYRSRYILKESPLVSIVIPNKDHVDDLKKCINSLEEKCNYENKEYIIVENNSTENKTFEYYDELIKKYSCASVIYWKEKGFNYSKINNYGARFAKGEYILFLNNDTEIQNSDFLQEMLGYCMRKDVGAVGARMFYEDGTIQHAGVIVGLGGLASHPYAGAPKETYGHMGRIHAVQELSAVTAACVLVKKEVFEKVKGFESQYAVAFNDIDLCMKIRKAGYRIIYTPYANLTHYESKSRGTEDSREKRKRFESEIKLFEKRWEKILKNGDPYYNRNFRLDESDFQFDIHVKKRWKL